jgi:hypothetical protein
VRRTPKDFGAKKIKQGSTENKTAGVKCLIVITCIEEELVPNKSLSYQNQPCSYFMRAD